MNKHAVVTGATGGIGVAIARRLAEQGCAVTLVGRGDQRLHDAVGQIRTAVPHAELRQERADLSRLDEVRDLASRLSRGPLPDVVISNAAVVAPVGTRTADGLPRTLVVNHLAPYLLLRSLVAPLGRRPARFVVVGASPTGLARTPVDVADLASERGLGWPPSMRPFVAYARTKNMNAMFVHALARRLSGTRITVNGVHPGIIRGTGLGRDARGALKLFGAALGPFSPGPDAGADTPAWLATSTETEGVSGRFYVRRTAVATAPHTTDAARCDLLWDESARLSGMPSALAP